MNASRHHPGWAVLRRCDPWMVSTALILLGVGIAFIYSAGRHAATLSSLWLKQLSWAGLAVLGCLGVVRTGYDRILRQAGALYAIAVAVLVLTLIAGVRINGARCWLNFLGIQLQPSELTKVATVLLLARELARPDLNAEHWSTLARAAVIAGIPFVLILLQPDLGTAMVLLPVTAAMLFVAGMRIRQLLTIGVAGLALLPVTWLFLDGYQKERIRVFFDPWRDPLGSGWNKIQSELAVGSGGLWGKGWLRGTQNTLGYLPQPVAPTDFIFSVIGEEVGFIGSSLLLLLFLVLLWRALEAASRAADRAGLLLAVGLATLVFVHVFVNLGMTIGLLPIVGLPLPLVSYGGSFLIATGLGLGLLLSVYAKGLPATM
jgi:rod shape determining protein RodA